MGERELERAVVEFLGARFLCLRVLEGRCLLPVPFQRLEAVEGRAGYAASGCAVHQQAGAAEPLKVFEIGQDGRLVELDALVNLIWRDLEPRRPRTGAVTRAVLTVQGRDLPLLDGRAASEHLRGLVANRPHPFGAGVHRLLGLPRAGRNATTGVTVDQQRHADAPVDLLECGHDHFANVRDSCVDGRRLRLDSGRARVHDPPLFSSGQRPGGATGSINTFLRRITHGNGQIRAVAARDRRLKIGRSSRLPRRLDR